MRKSILPLALFLFAAVLFSSCKKETTSLSEMEKGHGFYPLEVGKYIVYDVDSLVWNDHLKATIPSQCQLRYNIADTFRNDEGELAYVINVLYRKTAAESYVPFDVMYAHLHHNQLIVTQHNLNFIKLSFPIENGKNWKGNAMIPLDDEDYAEYNNDKWNYIYSDFNQSYNTGMKLFQHTVTVNEIDDQLNDPDTDSTAYAYRNYAQEVYAHGVGMVYKERIYWVFQPKSPDGGSGGSGYRKGYSIIMKAVDHN